MTDETDRPSIFVIIPPPLWAVVFIAAGWGLGAALELPPVLKDRTIGFVIFLAGFLISSMGRHAFARAGTEVIPVSKKNSSLVTDGPFRYTRNPMYFGILLATAGISLTIGTLTALAAPLAFFLFVNFVSIPYEERKMERQFGEAYRNYKNKVRRWI